MKHFFLLIFTCITLTIVRGQNIQQQELELNSYSIGEKGGSKMNVAWKLLEIDSLNFEAIKYITSYYSRIGRQDSIKIFFDYLHHKYPQSAVPYIYKVKLEDEYEDVSKEELVGFLKKGHSVDPTNQEVIYQLGKKYYEYFHSENRYEKANLDHYAEQAITSFEKLSGDNCFNPRAWAPLVQLYHYQGNQSQLRELQKQNLCDSLYFPVLTFGIVSKKEEFGFYPLPPGWETDYSIDMIWATERSLFHINWYSKHLKALEEPILWHGADSDIIRFTLLPSFTSPITVRIENNNGQITLYWKTTNGSGGYDPGKLTLNEKKSLKPTDWKKIINRLNRKGFWKMPAINDEGGLDGAQYILEAQINGKYHIVDRWCGYGIEDICMEILKHTGMEVK